VITPAPLLASAGYLIRQAWKQKRATAMQRSNTPAKPMTPVTLKSCGFFIANKKPLNAA